MSVVTVLAAKEFMRVTHDRDDDLIQRLIDGAEDEAKQYLDRDELPRRDDPIQPDGESDSTLNAASDIEELAPSIFVGICLLAQAEYEAPSAAEAEQMRNVAFAKMRSYRKFGT